MRRRLSAGFTALVLAASGCNGPNLQDNPGTYREYAYIANGGSNTVTVLDLVNMRQDRVIRVGNSPGGVAANPRRDEVYVVNSGTGTVTVIDSRSNTVAATIAVHRQPYFIDVDRQGRRGYVANSGSNNVSVLDLISRREIAVIGAGRGPGLARIAPDNTALVITNRVSGSVSVADPHTFKTRSSFDRCPGATDAVILPDSSKALIACSGSHRIMVLRLAHPAEPDPSPSDRLLAFLDVGQMPVQIALKPDGGEAFVANFNSGTISEIGTPNNEVGGSFLVGSHPVRGLVNADNSLLYVANFGSGRLSIYGIDDGKLIGPGVRLGEGPDAMAFSASGHFLFVVDSQSGDVAAVRTQPSPPSLLTLFPTGRAPNSIAVKALRLP